MRLEAGAAIVRVAVTAIAGLIAVGLAFGAWFVASDRADYNGPRYVLWKHGVLPFDPSIVYPAMVGDKHREQLVIGMTLSELKDRFGRLRERVESTEYQKYYSNHFFLKQHVVWLGDSAWLVVLSNGRAQSLHLMKG